MATLTQQLSAKLRGQIEAGEFSLGSRLPTLRELEALHGVSEITARGALRELRDLGLVEMKPRVGTVVVATRPLVWGASGQKTVALVLPSLADPFFSRIAHGAEAECARSGLRLVLVATNGDPKQEKEALETLPTQVGGIAIFPIDTFEPAPYQNLRELGVPFVFLDRAVAPETAPLVSVNNENAGFLAGQHLISLERPIWVITHPLACLAPIDDRIRGVRRALQTHGLPFDTARILQARGLDEAVGAFLAREILAQLQTQQPLSVLAINEAIARGAYAVFQAQGIAIPQQVAIVSFGDSAAPLLSPPMTAIDLGEESWGRQAVALLARMLGGEKVESPTPLPTRLIIRGSCGADSEFCRVESLLQSARDAMPASNVPWPPVLV